VKPRRPWDDPKYRQRRQLLMASITPATKCWRCGRTASEHPLHASGRPGHWQAGHTVDGRNDAPLAAEFSTCNAVAGGKLGYQRGIGRELAARRVRQVDPHLPGHYNLSDATSPGMPPCVRHGGGLCESCAAWRAQNPQRG
jgi:hypothetical protein